MRKRARLRSEHEEVKGLVHELENQIRQSGEKQEQLTAAYADLLTRRKECFEELAAVEPGEKHDEVLGRLARILRFQAQYEQDPKWQREAEEIEEIFVRDRHMR